MYLSCYHFVGEPAALLSAYERMVGTFPAGAIQFQVCVERPDGLRVYDGCPTRDDFVRFSGSPEFAAAVAAAGLPAPRVEEVGEVQNLIATSS